MKLRVTVDGKESLLDFECNGADAVYGFEGAIGERGAASVAQIGPGAFSVLLGGRSFTIDVIPSGNEFEASANGQQFRMVLADVRDRSAKLKKQSVAGPMELRAQMPGKIIKLLVEPGSNVQVGQSLIVVEAMKMQNEMKSPKDGIVTKIHAVEGATVAAGEQLMVVE